MGDESAKKRMNGSKCDGSTRNGLNNGGYKEMKSIFTCHLSLLTNSALVHEPKCGGTGGLRGLSAVVYSCIHRRTKAVNETIDR